MGADDQTLDGELRVPNITPTRRMRTLPLDYREPLRKRMNKDPQIVALRQQLAVIDARAKPIRRAIWVRMGQLAQVAAKKYHAELALRRERKNKNRERGILDGYGRAREAKQPDTIETQNESHQG